jgi:hypothetical protein
MNRVRVVPFAWMCSVLVLAACGGDDKKLELGGSCTLNSDCKDPLVCKLGGCHQACMQTRDCPTGERCVKVDGMGVCQQPAESQCVYGGPVTCKTPLACAADNLCRRSCATAGDCVVDQECVANVCLETAEAAAWRTDGGAGSDGGTSIGPDGGIRDGKVDGGDTDGKPDAPITTGDAAVLDVSSTSVDLPRAPVDGPIDLTTSSVDGPGSGQTDTTVPTERLVAYYPFSGNAQDESGNGNHGTVYGATPGTDRFGASGRAYHFDGHGQYILVNDSATLNFASGELSISLWFSAESWESPASDHEAWIIAKENQLSNQREFDMGHYFTSNSLYFGANSGGRASTWAWSETTTVVLGINEWHHVVGINDGAEIRLYINGVLEDSRAGAATIFNGSESMSIGDLCWNGVSQSKSFHGLIDDIRIYGRALANAEVQALYRENGWVGRSE